ncbi:MAG: hypothetical protein AAGL24_05800 [Pseudomonadota bacterium]
MNQGEFIILRYGCHDVAGGFGGGQTFLAQAEFRSQRMAVAGISFQQTELYQMIQTGGKGRSACLGYRQQWRLPARNAGMHEGQDFQ